MKKYILLLCWVFIIPFDKTGSANDDVVTIAWGLENISSAQQNLVWQPLDGESFSGTRVIQMHAIRTYAVAPVGGRFAYVDAGGQVRIVEVHSVDEVVLDVTVPLQEFPLIYDENYHTQSLLDWSPNGEQLAIVGDGALYIYHVLAATPQIIQAEPSDKINISSWSPSGRYLAYFRLADANSYLYDMREGKEVSIGHRICRVTWSPNEMYFTTTNHCDKATGANSVISVFEVGEAITKINELSESADLYSATYSRPYWTSDQTFAMYMNRLEYATADERYTIVHYNLERSTMSLDPARQLAVYQTFVQDNQWLFALEQDSDAVNWHAYNLSTGQQINNLSINGEICIAFSTQLYPAQTYLSYLDDCQLNGADGESVSSTVLNVTTLETVRLPIEVIGFSVIE